MALFKLIRMQQANELQHAKAGQTMRSSIYGKVERGSAMEESKRDRGIERLATLQTEGCSSICSTKQGGIREGFKGVDGRQQTLFSAFTD